MLNNLSLKEKLLLIILPLTLALLISSGYILKEDYDLLGQLKGFEHVTDSFGDIGSLLNSIQKERGNSGLFLYKKITKEDLDKLRGDTDKWVLELRRMQTLIPFNGEDQKKLTEALDSIATIRRKIDAFDISSTDILKSYSKIVEVLLNTEAQGAKIYQGKGIQPKLLNLVFLEWFKETIALSRGSYSAALAANKPLTTEESQALLIIRGAVRLSEDSPAIRMNSFIYKSAHALVKSDEWIELTRLMDIVIAKSAQGNFGVDTKEFLTKMTAFIGNVDDLLDPLKQQILEVPTIEYKKTLKFFYITIGVVLLLVIAMGAIVYKVFSEIIIKEKELALATLEAQKSEAMVKNSPLPNMMCDTAGTLISMNQASFRKFKELEQFLPIKVEDMIGKKVDVFHKDPAMQMKIISDPKNLPHKALITVGPETIELNISAVIDDKGTYLGAGVSWNIVTSRSALIKELAKSAGELNNASTNVLSISNNLSSAAEETSAQANTASVASEEVNAGVQTVAGNMEQMVSAIKEITKTTNEAATLTNEAMRMAKNTNTIINKLGDSSIDIGNVIKVISSIAQQTNLLALNATIEAARAGEAGKGFAVVANEVKELANQTAKATNEITRKIETIQQDSQNAVTAIAEITATIEKVNGYTGNIAASVEEQAATTNEVTRIIGESATGVKQITENISQVSAAAASTGKDAGNAQTAANSVGAIAEVLQSYVKRLIDDQSKS